jgi:hypothetical protein
MPVTVPAASVTTDVTGSGGDTCNDCGRDSCGDYCFGKVDALAAVCRTEVWRCIHVTPQTSANEQTTTGFDLTVASGLVL